MPIPDIVTVVEDSIEIIEVGGGGAPARPTPGTFILDVTSTGVVGSKTHTAEGAVLLTCSTDTAGVRVAVGCEGDATLYTPIVTVNGVPATMVESATKRWFLGYADILLTVGDNTVTATSSTGSKGVAVISRVGAGPAITSMTWGAYPGTQTELKAGDSIQVTIYTEPTATSVTLQGGSVCNSPTFPAVGGVATGSVIVAGASGTQTITAHAQNSFGTFGDLFNSPSLLLNQTYPNFSAITVAYPAGQGALKGTESATVSCTVGAADTVTYSAAGLTVAAGYAAAKSVTLASTGYVVSGTNYSISATRAANGATAGISGLVKIATSAPTAAITLQGNPTRMISSPTGYDTVVQVTPNQVLTGAPTLTTSVGTWQGAWSLTGGVWSRALRITDADVKGAGLFSSLSVTGLSLLTGTTITSGAAFTVGGMSPRTLTFAAFSRVAALGTTVGDQTKTSAAIVGGNTLTRYTNAGAVANGYYIANADGSYNANGAYLGLSDSALAGANTSGSLQATFAESA